MLVIWRCITRGLCFEGAQIHTISWKTNNYNPVLKSTIHTQVRAMCHRLLCLGGGWGLDRGECHRSWILKDSHTFTEGTAHLLLEILAHFNNVRWVVLFSLLRSILGPSHNTCKLQFSYLLNGDDQLQLMDFSEILLMKVVWKPRGIAYMELFSHL